MTRFIVRVDDVGQAPEQQKLDHGLEYFMSWWKAGGWGDAPIYLGVVPAGMSHQDLYMLRLLELATEAEVCIHGWDHGREVLSHRSLELAKKRLPSARAVIPPYNLYDARSIEALHVLKLSVLFGGMHEPNAAGREADHPYGPRPRMIGDVLHLSAEWALTKHSYQLVDVVKDFPDPGYPVVITLHHRWDVDFFTGVRQLREALEGQLVTIEEALRCVSLS